MRIEVYICPTPGCGGYYGSSNMPALELARTSVAVENRWALKQATGRDWTHTRARCPDCGADRVLTAVNVPRPAPKPISP